MQYRYWIIKSHLASHVRYDHITQKEKEQIEIDLGIRKECGISANSN